MILLLCVLVPLAGALIVLIAGERRVVAVGMIAAIATAATTFAAVASVASEGPLTLELGGWAPPLGIALRADGLSATMLAMGAVVGTAISVYAARYLPVGTGGWREAHSFWPLWLILWSALNAVFVAGDAFNVYVALELLTLPAVAMVALERNEVALSAAMRYLLAALVASLAYLLGVALLYGETASLDLLEIEARIEPGLATGVAIAALSAGLMTKAALFPLHFWLPRAHASAPAPVSAALSALVVTAAAYLVLRLWLGALEPALTAGAVDAAAVLGSAAIVWGSVQALRAERLKMLIAYSTVAQVGYLFVVLALVWGGGSLGGGFQGAAETAWQGGVLHAVSHAFAKAALFLAAGNIVLSIAGDRLDHLGGTAARLPISVGAIGLAGISLAGLPMSGGFSAKWLLIVAAIERGTWWWAAVLVVGGLLAAAYCLRAIRPAFVRDPAPNPPKPVPRTLELCALGLALAAIGLGFFGAGFAELLGVSA